MPLYHVQAKMRNNVVLAPVLITPNGHTGITLEKRSHFSHYYFPNSSTSYIRMLCYHNVVN